jgi:hypothetical protein
MAWIARWARSVMSVVDGALVDDEEGRAGPACSGCSRSMISCKSSTAWCSSRGSSTMWNIAGSRKNAMRAIVRSASPNRWFHCDCRCCKMARTSRAHDDSSAAADVDVDAVGAVESAREVVGDDDALANRGDEPAVVGGSIGLGLGQRARGCSSCDDGAPDITDIDSGAANGSSIARTGCGRTVDELATARAVDVIDRGRKASGTSSLMLLSSSLSMLSSREREIEGRCC